MEDSSVFQSSIDHILRTVIEIKQKQEKVSFPLALTSILALDRSADRPSASTQRTDLCNVLSIEGTVGKKIRLLDRHSTYVT